MCSVGGRIILNPIVVVNDSCLEDTPVTPSCPRHSKGPLEWNLPCTQ